MAQFTDTSVPVTQVMATGVASSANASGNTDLASQIEAAMQQALRECLDKGITDPNAQREAMLAARDARLAE